MSLSPKQILSFNQAQKRLNIWVGAVRSGKTFSSILKFIEFLKNGPKGDAMIIGVNRESIQRNVLTEMYNLLGFPLPSSKTTSTKLYGRNVYFTGAHDESAVRAIQGSTLACAYVDEITCIPAPFWRMLLSRLSITGAQLFGTCNPDGPAHWFKKEYIDRESELNLIHWDFTLDDNPSLDEGYKTDLKTEYVGMWYNRYILGQWTAAHGLIYDGFDDINIYTQLYNPPNYYVVGLDYGTTNATAAVLCAITPKMWPQIKVEAEYYYDSNLKGRSKTDQELVDDIKAFIAYKNVRAIYIDPAAASLKIEMRKRDLPVVDAINDVILGIKIVSKFITNKNLCVHKSCKTLIEQIQSYQWDHKAADRGEDKPLKVNDHICVVGNTIVETQIGKYFIRRIYGSNARVKTWDGEKFIFSNCSSVQKTGIQRKILKLTLKNGKYLKATPDHKIMTRRGFIEIQFLLPDDEILCYD
jgi:PBSX family phage terminase large subunit